MLTTSISAAVVGPLQSLYTPPAACFTPVFSPFTETVGIGTYSTYYKPSFGIRYEYESLSFRAREGYVLVSVYLTSCYPTSDSPYTAYTPDVQNIIQPYYSPGLNCPVGYTSACSVTKKLADQAVTSGPGWDWSPAGRALWSQLPDNNTAINCCPSSWECFEQLSDEYPPDYLTPALIAKCTLPSGEIQSVTGILTEDLPTFVTSYKGVTSPTVKVMNTSIPLPKTSAPTLKAVVIVRGNNDAAFGTVIESSSGRFSQTGKIIVAVVVPVTIINLGALAWKCIVGYRRRRQAQRVEQGASSVGDNSYGPA